MRYSHSSMDKLKEVKKAFRELLYKNAIDMAQADNVLRVEPKHVVQAANTICKIKLMVQ